MKAAAGTTSSSVRSSAGRASASADFMPRLPQARAAKQRRRAVLASATAGSCAARVARIDQGPFDGNVKTHVLAETDVRRRAYVQQHTRRRDDVDERIAAAVFDVVDMTSDAVDAVAAFAHRDLFRTNRHRRPTSF